MESSIVQCWTSPLASEKVGLRLCRLEVSTLAGPALTLCQRIGLGRWTGTRVAGPGNPACRKHRHQ